MKADILKEIRYVQKRIRYLKRNFDSQDIRLSFFDGLHAILCQYYTHVVLIDTEYFLDTYREILNDKYLNTSNIQIQKQNAFNNANSSLIVNSWSNFELFISYFTESHFSETIKTELLNDDFNKMVLCFKKQGIQASELKCISNKRLPNYHLVPSMKKITKLLKMLEDQFENRSLYKEALGFLTNFSRIRNCLHSNFIFHGSSIIEDSFNNISITYIPNEPIIMCPLEKDTSFKMVVRLREIGEFMIDNSFHAGIIRDPTHLVKNSFA